MQIILAITAWMVLLLPIYGQDKTEKTSQKQHNSQGSDQLCYQAPVTVNCGNINAGVARPGSKANDSEQKPQGYIHALISADNLPTVLLVIVGALGIWYARKTLRNLTKQTDAALLNAKALVASEKPYIVIRRKPRNDSDICEIIGINRGRTPAEVISISGLIETQDFESQNPTRPLEGLFLPRSALTTPRHSFRIQELSFKWCKDKLESEAASGILSAFFEVKYWDMFTDRDAPAATPHITRMCFTIDPYNRRLHRKATNWTCHK